MPTPTQIKHPSRATLRTAFAALVGLCALMPIITAQLGLDADKLPWLAVPLAIAAAVTRILAIPAVEDFLQRFLPWLSAVPSDQDQRDEQGSVRLLSSTWPVTLSPRRGPSRDRTIPGKRRTRARRQANRSASS